MAGSLEISILLENFNPGGRSDLPILVFFFFVFLAFLILWFSLFFFCVRFALLSKDFKDSAERTILAFFGGSSLFYKQKKQGLEGQ